MPGQVLALALAGSIYPPAIAAVIALGRGDHLRSRVLAFVLAALLVTLASGVLMILVLNEVGASGPRHRSPSAAIDLALGVLLIVVAVVLRRRGPRPGTAPRTSGASLKIERYLQSRRLAFVLGITLYVIPSPIYIGAVKEITDAQLSTSGEVLALAATVVVMLWLIEVPMLILLVAPDRGASGLARVNSWFAQHGRVVAIVACTAAGAYLAIKGLVELLG